MDGKAVNVHKEDVLEIMQTTLVSYNSECKRNGTGGMQCVSLTIDPRSPASFSNRMGRLLLNVPKQVDTLNYCPYSKNECKASVRTPTFAARHIHVDIFKEAIKNCFQMYYFNNLQRRSHEYCVLNGLLCRSQTSLACACVLVFSRR